MPTTTSSADKRQTLIVLLAFAAIYVLWGTTYLAIRVAVETIPPFFMAGVRFLLAGGILLAALRLRGVKMPTRPQWRSAAVIGAFLLLGGNGLVTWSEQKIPSGTAALVVATVPLWMTAFDWLLYRRTTPARKVLLGLLLGSLGIGLLVGPGLDTGQAAILWSDWAIILLAPVLWSIGSLHSRQANLPENAFLATALEMLTGGALLLLAGFLTGEAARLDLATISTRSLLATFYLIFLGSIVAFTAYIWLLKTVEAAKVATYTYVNPIIAVGLGWLLLNETVTPQMLLAVVVIITGVIFITKRQSQARRQPEPPSLPEAIPCESPSTP
ncbi:MAG: drug/metabolite exporter YedA [Candidatus Promineifilaceae bacterium]